MALASVADALCEVLKPLPFELGAALLRGLKPHLSQGRCREDTVEARIQLCGGIYGCYLRCGFRRERTKFPGQLAQERLALTLNDASLSTLLMRSVPPRDWRLRIEDMLDAAESIEEFVKGADFGTFRRDRSGRAIRNRARAA